MMNLEGLFKGRGREEEEEERGEGAERGWRGENECYCAVNPRFQSD
jgi:hypothetical protein